MTLLDHIALVSIIALFPLVTAVFARTYPPVDFKPIRVEDLE